MYRSTYSTEKFQTLFKKNRLKMKIHSVTFFFCTLLLPSYSVKCQISDAGKGQSTSFLRSKVTSIFPTPTLLNNKPQSLKRCIILLIEELVNLQSRPRDMQEDKHHRDVYNYYMRDEITITMDLGLCVGFPPRYDCGDSTGTQESTIIPRTH